MVKHKILKGEATPEQIAAWKQEHGKVFAYKVNGKVCYLAQVSRDAYALAASKIREAGPAKFNDVILEQIWLGGDDEIRHNDSYYFGLIDFIEELMAKKKGQLTEL